MEKLRDERGYFAAVLMDLSKAFDTINHGPLIAKLHAHTVHGKSLKLVRDYLCNRFQRTTSKVDVDPRSFEFIHDKPPLPRQSR